MGSNVRQGWVPAPAALMVVLSNLGFWLAFPDARNVSYESIRIDLCSTAAGAACPDCGSESTRVGLALADRAGARMARALGAPFGSLIDVRYARYLPDMGVCLVGVGAEEWFGDAEDGWGEVGAALNAELRRRGLPPYEDVPAETAFAPTPTSPIPVGHPASPIRSQRQRSG
ncbi:hypothetical protein ACL02U_09100 [Streptomyces sp. MS06]|uniref:hypothetical protein n=1 Tax=Streptomyces sp. MS06 TaxID=3385974 RepID=UPI00399F1ACA